MDFCLAMSNVQRTHCNGLWELGKVLNPAMGSLFVYCIMDRFVPKHPMGLDNLPPSAIVYVVHLCVCARVCACTCVFVCVCVCAFMSACTSSAICESACECIRVATGLLMCAPS
jgi:branched-subunit amino acid transport protein AzlD